jgi:hypothetical protein
MSLSSDQCEGLRGLRGLFAGQRLIFSIDTLSGARTVKKPA